MRINGLKSVITIFIAIFQDGRIIGEVLDTGTIYVPIHGSYHLKCQNKTEGRFNSLVWRSSAYSKGKHGVYTYIIKDRKEDVYSSFVGRIKRYDGTSIHIQKARPEDSGNWECNILFYYKPEGEAEWRLRVRVLAVYDVVVVSPPTITRVYPTLVAVISDYQANSFCDAHGLSPFNLTWMKDSGGMSKHVKLMEKDFMKGRYYAKRSFIRFQKLSHKDVGTYTCVAGNMAGRGTRKIQVKVQVRPIITSQSEAIAHQGKEALIVCNATAYPKVHFVWKFTSKNMEYINLRSGESRDNGKFRLSKTEHKSNGDTTYAVSKLHIRNVQRENWGVYLCNVESEIGWARKDIKLSGFSLPSPPVIVPRKRIYPNQVDLKWELHDDGGSPIRSITVQYKSNLNKYWSTIQVSKPLSQYTVTNLEANFIYDFRVLSTNDVGDSAYSEVFQVQTSPEEIKVTPQKQTFGELGVISFIGVCGAALVGLTCAIGCICLYFQEKRINRYQVTRQDIRGAATHSTVNHYN